MQRPIPTAEQGTPPALPQTTENTCKYPSRTNCLGCEYSYAPDLFDGGCLAGYTPEERQVIRAANPMPRRRA